MDANTTISALGVIIGAIGVLFVILAAIEYSRLASLRRDFDAFKTKIRHEQYNSQKALQRVISSYNISDPDRRIELLNSAIKTDPSVFNGFNALGYAYLEKGDIDEAIDAFKDAINQHPDMKEGYIDLATLYLKQNKRALCKKYLRKAINADKTALNRIKSDTELSSHLD